MADELRIPWWQWLPIFRWRMLGQVVSADEIPEQLPRNSSVLVGSIEKPKWLGFDCPCRRGHRIVLNFDRSRRPAWALNVSRSGRLTISPSIDYEGDGFRCHYFIQNGRVLWAKDSY